MNEAMRHWGALVLALLGAVIAAPVARAEPLDPAVCAKLTEEHAALVAAGVKADMERGPAWAKANLPPDRLRRIGHYMSVDEQLNFRCGLAKQRIVLPTVQEGGEELLPGSDGTPAGAAPHAKKTAKGRVKSKPKEAKAGEPAAHKAKPHRRARPKAKAKAADAHEAAEKAAPAKAHARHRRAPRKVDDAYHPPARKGSETPASPAPAAK